MADEVDVSCQMKIQGQNWFLLNMVGPGLRQNMGVGQKTSCRILGCFSTKQEAEAHAAEYRKKDDRFDIYVVQMYEWWPILHEIHEVGDIKYDREEQNDLFKIHENTKTQTNNWNKRLEDAKLNGVDGWAPLE